MKMEYNLSTGDAYAALRIKDFRLFVYARFLLIFSTQMQSVVVGWQVYKLTHDALSLGLIGLSEALPFLAISLFAGHAADVLNRKKIVLISIIVYVVCSTSLLVISTSLSSVLVTYGAVPIYLIIFVTGLARGFLSPAQSAFGTQLIPQEFFGNASTWNSVTWHVAEITGPAVGGLVYGFFNVGSAYTIIVATAVLSWIFFVFIKNRPMPQKTQEETIWQSLSTGLKFVFGNQVILSALSLDMFAVFFGGAVAVLPIFADQVLHIGAKGLGFLRAAPAIGSVTMSFILAHNPPFKKAGRNLLVCVFCFGLCIIAFALSRNFYLTLFILLLSGMFDNVSVVIRWTIIQLYTPNEMRGRVSAVNGIFIGSSNELGSFESGLAAKIMGLIPSVIFGGSMTLGIVAAVRKLAPKLRKLSI